MTRILCLLAAAMLGATAARAQTQLVQTQNQVSPVVQVQALAPQLVQFAGSDVNFANLVNGLSFGLPVTLTTPIGPGVTQVTSFTPAGTLTPLQIAQLLETARQTAISNGIATPTAQQIAVILNGGTLPTAAGTTAVSGLMSGNTSGTGTSATGTPSTATTTTSTSPAALLQSQRSFTVSDSPFPRGISDTPTTTGSTTLGTATPATGTTTPQPVVTPGTSTAAGATTPRFGPAPTGSSAAGSTGVLPPAARIGTPAPFGAR